MRSCVRLVMARPVLASSSIYGADVLAIEPAQSSIDCTWFFSIWPTASPVLDILLKASSIVPALSAMAPMFSVNLSFCSPVSEPNKRRASALPNSWP